METQSNTRQKDSGNTDQHKIERQWKHRSTQGRKTVKTQINTRQKDSGNTDQHKTVETQSNTRQKDSGNTQSNTRQKDSGTQINTRQKDSGNTEQHKAERQWNTEQHKAEEQKRNRVRKKNLELSLCDCKARGEPVSRSPSPLQQGITIPREKGGRTHF